MAYKGVCVAVLLSFYGHTASSNKYVEMEAPVWNITHPPCTLATPSMTYTKVGQKTTEKITIAYGDELAVGYIKVPAAFENIGCIKQGDLGSDKHHTVPSDPGECYSACNTTLFGIYDHDCFCFKKPVSANNDKRNKCVKRCASPETTVCGGKDGDEKFISVYKNVSLKYNSEEANNCRYVKLPAKNFFWNDCNVTLNGICDAGRLEDTGKGKLNWKEYTTQCYSNKGYPASEASFQNWTPKASLLNLNQNNWIGQMKSWIVVEYRNWDSSLGASLRYGYIKLKVGTNRNTTQLMFTQAKPGRLLCLNDPKPEITSTTDPKPEITSTTINSQTVSTSSGEREYLNDGNSVNGGLLATYVVVPIVVIATAIVVVFVIWKRRLRANGTDSRYADYNGNAKGPPPDLKTAASNAAYDSDITSKPLESDDQRHDYFVLEAPTEYATIKEESIANSADAEYDTTDMRNDWRHAATGDGNVYNMLSDQQDDTYNHTDNDAGNKKECGESNIGFQNTEDTYNHVVEDDAYSTTA